MLSGVALAGFGAAAALVYGSRGLPASLASCVAFITHGALRGFRAARPTTRMTAARYLPLLRLGYLPLLRLGYLPLLRLG